MRPTFLTGSVAAILLFSMLAVSASAQNRPQRREFIQGLLKDLIESQIEDAQNGNRQSGPRPYPQGRLPNTGPGLQPKRVPARPQLTAATPRVIKVRKQLGVLSSNCDEVIEVIRVHEQKIPRLRVMLGDCLQLKASVDSLVRQSKTCLTIDPLTQGYATLDQNWRVLQNQLTQVRGLPADCQRRIASFKSTESSLCELMEIQPQVNRAELIRLASALATNIEHLVQDIQYDLRSDPQYRQIMKQGQTVYSILSQSGPVIQHGSYDEIVGTLKTGTAEWRKFSASLRGHVTPRLSQDIQRIETISAGMRELLWLPQELDRDYLCDVIGTIESGSNRMLEGITVADLLACKQPGVVLTSARDFQTRCGEFSTGVGGDMSIDELAWQYQDFQNQWQGLQTQLVSFSGPRIEAGCDEVTRSMAILQQSFGDGLVINRDTMLGICRDLDSFTHQLSASVHQRVTRNAYKELHTKACPCVSQLHQQCHQLHEHVIRSRGDNYNVTKFADPVFKQWSTLKPMLNQCKPEHRSEFMAIRRQIEPLMVKLQVVYAH